MARKTNRKKRRTWGKALRRTSNSGPLKVKIRLGETTEPIPNPKPVGKVGMAKRMRRKLVPNEKGVFNKPSIRRLAKRAGARRISLTGSQGMIPIITTLGRNFIKNVVDRAELLTSNRGQKTVRGQDIIRALKMLNMTYYR